MTRPAPLVVVINDDVHLCDTVSGFVESAGMIVRSYGGCRSFLADTSSHDCDCLVLDVRLPDGNGLALHRQLAEKGAKPPVIYISDDGSVPLVVQAMRQGALDFLQKPFAPQSLLARVHEAVIRSTRRRKQRAADEETRTRVAALTPREKEIMERISRGLPNKDIGHHLGISVRTVEHHRARVMHKMGADSLPALVTMLGRLDR